MGSNAIQKNKKAFFNYEILDTVVAGMQLYGTEIKSIRLGKASLKESYCFFHKDELFIKSMHISEYEMGTHGNHAPLRERKLLLKRKELDKLQKKVKEGGVTIIPLKLFINERGWAKLEIALAKGKKLHDKRETLKKKEAKREIDRQQSAR